VAATEIHNPSVEPCALPYPFRGVLQGGQRIIVALTVAQVSALLAGSTGLLVAQTTDTGQYSTLYQGDALLLANVAVAGFSGAMPPRMTTTQRDALTTPPAGLVIYNTTTNKLNVRVVAAWEVVTSV
jgi:hypothetical protein